MKKYLILMILLGGCANTSMEELETEAVATGDWSAVEAREASIRRKQQRKEYIAYCTSIGKVYTCSYIPRESDKCSCQDFQ